MANWRVSIGDNILDSKRDITIINKEIRYMSTWKKPSNEKWVQYKCNKCGYVGWSPEKAIMQGKGCLGCNGKETIVGINDIATTASHVVKYLLNPEDAYKYKRRSSAIVKTKCPFCGDIRDYRIAQLTIEPYVCHKCGKNISVSERLFNEFLKMYHIDYIYQLSKKHMSWCKNYRYDFYIIPINAIIELHGKQHYENGIYNRSYEEIHNVDVDKYNLAMRNGIDKYYQVPATKSTKEALIATIMDLELIQLLNINKEHLKDNLEKAYINIIDKRTVDICKYYEENRDYSAVKIAQHFNITSTTVLRALWEGTKSGLCHYDGQERLRITQIKNNRVISKPIIIIDPNGGIHEFASIREAERMSYKTFGIYISRFFIKKHCNNNEPYKGYYINYR